MTSSSTLSAPEVVTVGETNEITSEPGNHNGRKAIAAVDPHFENAPVAQCHCDASMRITQANRGFRKLLARSQEKIIGVRLVDLLGEHCGNRLEIVSTLAEGRDVENLLTDVTVGDDNRRWTMLGVKRFSTGYSVALTDVTAFIKSVRFDYLTGLEKREAFDQSLEQMHALLERGAITCLSVITVDTDHFKQVNDIHGHDAGDEVLKALGALLHNCRRTDLAGRYSPNIPGRLGGEEFALLLPGTDLEGAHIVAERIRNEIAALRVCIDEKTQKTIRVTASLGISSHTYSDVALGLSTPAPLTPKSLMKEADIAMYASKHNGRNQTSLFNPKHRKQ